MKWKKMILPVQIGMAAGERSELIIEKQQKTTPL
jgi:predicted small secreted protein